MMLQNCFYCHLQKLRKIILQDELGICSELDAFMDNLVNTYEDEWASVVKGQFHVAPSDVYNYSLDRLNRPR